MDNKFKLTDREESQKWMSQFEIEIKGSIKQLWQVVRHVAKTSRVQSQISKTCRFFADDNLWQQ